MDFGNWATHCSSIVPLFLIHADFTFQGLVPYYFQILYPGRALELNYCIWNDNNYLPIKTPKGHTEAKGQCTTLQENCEDCRFRPLEGTESVHFTACYNPCLGHFHIGNDPIHNAKFHALLHEWFQTRSALEQSCGRSGHGQREYENRIGNSYSIESMDVMSAATETMRDALVMNPSRSNSRRV